MRADRTDRIDDSGPAPVSAKSAASIQAQLSSSPPTALLDSSSATYRTPYVVRPDSPDRLPLSVGARHSPYAARQHTYPFTHRSRSPPALVACAERGLSRVSRVVNNVNHAAYLLFAHSRSHGAGLAPAMSFVRPARRLSPTVAAHSRTSFRLARTRSLSSTEAQLDNSYSRR